MDSRISVSLLAVAAFLTTGCAAAPAVPARPLNHSPWAEAGASPSAVAVEHALYADLYGLDHQRCPFFTARCADDNSPDTDFLKVEKVSCRAGPRADRCGFVMIERQPGRPAVRSRCHGLFEIVGTSHEPMRWGVKMDDEYDEPTVRCRRIGGG